MKKKSIEKINPHDVVPSIKKYLLALQNDICAMVQGEESDGIFLQDEWQHAEGGGGITRVLMGKVIEKAGVNFSHVSGIKLPAAATARSPQLANAKFQALGVSVVIHPYNPFVPTSHFNVRFILVEPKDADPHWWFGGGFDLTPYYGFFEDCQHWHQTAKSACAEFGDDVYSIYKKQADDYFFLKHRNEPRGIGGIFFDDLNTWGLARCFTFMRSVGDHFIKAYQPIIARRKKNPFTAQHRDFQLYRRGRYVEFNLLYDRGTLFGLQSGGRTESILMSLPPMVAWRYNETPTLGSQEEKLYREFLIPKNWI